MSILSASVPNSCRIFSSNSSTMPSHWNYKIWTQSVFIKVSQVVCKIYIHALYTPWIQKFGQSGHTMLSKSKNTKFKTCNTKIMLSISHTDSNVTPLSRIMTGLPTGHSQWKGQLFKLGLAYSPRCDRRKQATETASHVLCDLETQALLRFRHLSHFLETRWLCWYLHQQGTELCSKCRAPKRLCKGLHKFGKDQGVDVTAIPTLM